jgi:hypothetical protein
MMLWPVSHRATGWHGLETGQSHTKLLLSRAPEFLAQSRPGKTFEYSVVDLPRSEFGGNAPRRFSKWYHSFPILF